MDQCVSFNIGKVHINANQINLLFNEHRKLCHKEGDFSFEYGTVMEEDEILLVGHSIGAEKNLKDYEFIMHTYINDQKVSETEINYNQVVELFTKENNSKLIDQTKNLYLENNQSQNNKKKYKEQVRRQKNGQKDEKQKLEPGRKDGYVINPQTGAEIKINGPTYNELCDSGKYIC